jgi:hypothetical protein
MVNYDIIGSMVVIAFVFYLIIYLLGRILNAKNLMNLALTNGIDAVFTLLLAFLLLNLIEGGDNSILSKSAFNFVNATININEAGCSQNLTCAYNSVFNRIYGNVSNLTFSIDAVLINISGAKTGVMRYQYGGGGGDILAGATGISKGSETDVAEGTIQLALAAIPTASFGLGFGGSYSVAAQRLISLRRQASTLYNLLTYIDELRKSVSDTTLITFLIISGALMRILLIGKGGGSFLMALGISLYIVLPASLLFGFKVVEQASSSLLGNTNLFSSLPSVDLSDEGGGGGYFLADTYPKPFSMKGLDRFPLDENAGKLVFLIFAYIIVISFSLLAVITTSSGLSSLFGAEVGIWMIAQIGRVA